MPHRLIPALLLSFSAGFWARTPAQEAPSREPYTWKNVEIVGGGFVPGIVMHPAEKNLMYARTDVGGSYRWDPSAKRWIPLTDFLGKSDYFLYGVESIGIDASDPERLYLACGMYTQPWMGNGVMLRSSDQGRTFERTNVPFKMGGNEDGRFAGERLAVDPNRGSILYFGSRLNGLWRSADYGVTWNPVASFPVTGPTDGAGVVFELFSRVHASKGKATPVIYVGVSTAKASLYWSSDAGATWQTVPDAPIGMMPVHGVLTRRGVLYLTYSDHPGPNGITDGAVYKYDTRNGKWANITPLAPGTSGVTKFGYAALAVDRKHPDTVMVSTIDRWWLHDDIYRSVDAGAHWKPMAATAVQDVSAAPWVKYGKSTSGFGSWIGDIAIDPFNSKQVLYTTGGGIWVSRDANAVDKGKKTHWAVGAEGIEETVVTGLISPPAGAHLLSALDDIGGFRHDDLSRPPAEAMHPPFFSNGTGIDFAELRPQLVVRVGVLGWSPSEKAKGAYSTDGGSTWTPFAHTPPGAKDGGAIAVSATGETIVWSFPGTWRSPGGAAFRSRDSGKSWNQAEGLPAGARVIADRVDPLLFYAIGRDCVYVSTDAAASFVEAASNMAPMRAQLRAVPGAKGDLWFATGAGLFHSSDAGATFTRIPSVQQGYAVGFGKAAPEAEYPAIFLGGKIDGIEGLYRSDDRGASWVRIDDDGHRFGSFDWVVIGDPRIFGRVYLGTNGRGILYGDMRR